MFKGMPKIFWAGTGLMYSWVFLFIILEMTIPGLPLKKVFGFPACYLYNWLFGLWIINIIISFLFYWSEEKREEKLKQEEGEI
ncbi:hypothetical protein DO021_13475 [Desulfobacter hydrogenophilus]|uniref:DUF3311 domain-containing protein n=1 Tax=Desulfobacter hydrogenophilus TaxID=2291 RepID=A0A328FDI6_9BACT|nr:hypothetical protein [Desulfobacter hydrogenophilus]NDY72959.1 hypothetical protein [Desulfobacter hydrogenophilus]QBH12460.1 hypothetical protein EYB58_05775 [Desulfobacter hydrogenophilus]RAM01492.1 hypothetical protein DO021_13475 [Desulfobacter hydrogenophilus]